MTTKQFRAALKRLQLSQLATARLFQSDARTARRWALGEAPIPKTIAILLRLLVAGKITPIDIVATHDK